MSLNLRDYVVDIKGRPLNIRLQLINHLKLLAEKVHTGTTVKEIKCYYYQFFFDTDNEWSSASSLKPDKNLIPISIEDFIAKFPLPLKVDITTSPHTDKRNLAFYKKSGEPWTEDELEKIEKYTHQIFIQIKQHVEKE